MAGGVVDSWIVGVRSNLRANVTGRSLPHYCTTERTRGGGGAKSVLLLKCWSKATTIHYRHKKHNTKTPKHPKKQKSTQAPNNNKTPRTPSNKNASLPPNKKKSPVSHPRGMFEKRCPPPPWNWLVLGGNWWGGEPYW